MKLNRFISKEVSNSLHVLPFYISYLWLYLILKLQITVVVIVVTVRCRFMVEFLGRQRFLDVHKLDIETSTFSGWTLFVSNNRDNNVTFSLSFSGFFSNLSIQPIFYLVPTMLLVEYKYIVEQHRRGFDPCLMTQSQQDTNTVKMRYSQPSTVLWFLPTLFSCFPSRERLFLGNISFFLEPSYQWWGYYISCMVKVKKSGVVTQAGHLIWFIHMRL